MNTPAPALSPGLPLVDSTTPNTNDVRRFVHRWFTLWEHRSAPKRLVPHLALLPLRSRHADRPGRTAVVANLARHVAPSGHLVAGFQLRRGYDIERYDADCAAAGLTLEVRFGWELGVPGGDVTVAGLDVGILAADGRLQRITGFFGDLTAAEAA